MGSCGSSTGLSFCCIYTLFDSHLIEDVSVILSVVVFFLHMFPFCVLGRIPALFVAVLGFGSGCCSSLLSYSFGISWFLIFCTCCCTLDSNIFNCLLVWFSNLVLTFLALSLMTALTDSSSQKDITSCSISRGSIDVWGFDRRRKNNIITFTILIYMKSNVLLL